MEFRKKSGVAVCFSILLTSLLLCGFAATGVYALEKGTPQSDLAISQDTIYEMNADGKVIIPFSISTIDNGNLCLGQIPNLNNAIKITYNIDAKAGTGLFVGMKTENQMGWYNYFSTGGNSGSDTPNRIQWTLDETNGFGKDSEYKDNYYLYVGTTETALKQIYGTITIEYIIKSEQVQTAAATPFLYDNQSFGPEVVYSPDKNGVVTIPFSIKQIKRGQGVCIGQVPCLTNADSITYSIRCENGKGIFVGTSDKLKDATDLYPPAWYLWCSDNTTDGNIQHTFDNLRGTTCNDNTGNFYIYVGSNSYLKEDTGTDLSDVMGTVTIQTYTRN